MKLLIITGVWYLSKFFISRVTYISHSAEELYLLPCSWLIMIFTGVWYLSWFYINRVTYISHCAEELYLLPCLWNYRANHCHDMFPQNNNDIYRSLVFVLILHKPCTMYFSFCTRTYMLSTKSSSSWNYWYLQEFGICPDFTLTV